MADYSFLDPKLLSRLEALPFESRSPMVGNVAGRHRSPHRGSSVEFAEYRKYVPGDDTRRLDWKVYGRSDRFYIKEFEADTNLRAYFVYDCSGSLAYHSENQEPKIDFARRLIATLSYLLVKQGDAVGLCCCREKLFLDIPPSRRPAQLQTIFESLEKHNPQGETGLVEALHTIAEKIPQRSLVIILSDFFVDLPKLSEALQHLHFRKHDVSLFHLMDPQELAFEFERPQKFVDLEDGSSLVAEPQLIMEEYQSILSEFLSDLPKTAHDALAEYQMIQTHESLEEIVSAFLINRLVR